MVKSKHFSDYYFTAHDDKFKVILGKKISSMV